MNRDVRQWRTNWVSAEIYRKIDCTSQSVRVTLSSNYPKHLYGVTASIWCTSDRTVRAIPRDATGTHHDEAALASVSIPCCSRVCPLLEVRAPSPGLQAHLPIAVATSVRCSRLHLPSSVRWRMAARCCPLMPQDAVLPAVHGAELPAVLVGQSRAD